MEEDKIAKTPNGKTSPKSDEEEQHCVKSSNENRTESLPDQHKSLANVGVLRAKEVVFREKIFVARPSLLEKHFDLDNGQHVVVFNSLVGFSVLAAMSAWAHDFSIYGNPLHHLWLVAWNFEQFPQTMLLWTAMFLSTVVFPFSGLKQLAHLAPGWSQPVPLWIAAYCCYQFAFFYFSLRALFWMELKGACSFIITCENTRIGMKVHSFVRENFSRARQMMQRRGDDKEQIKNTDSEPVIANEWPTLSQFVYFMFCPSMLYRDSYPRSESRSWYKVGRHAMGCLASMYMITLGFSQVVIPLYSQLRYPEDTHLHFLFYTIFPSALPGAVCLFFGIFYGLLHSWLSMFAEAMRFADRHFYANWWSSKNMAEYYRNWNLVIHEWLYFYVYRDISLLIRGNFGSTLGTICVFLFSSIFHEYWFGVSLRMFYPVIFTLYFGFGGVFFLISKLIKRPYIWNIIMWWNLLFGTGIFISFYSSEWYARQRCSQIYESDLMDILVPRLWFCSHSTI